MQQTAKALNSVLRKSPNVLTVYQGHDFLPMFNNVNLYCLVVPQICQPAHPFPSHICPVITHQGLDFDLCVGLSGGGDINRILKTVSKETKTQLISYELDYIYDIVSCCQYKGNGELYPSRAFMEACRGSGEVLTPSISQAFRPISDILSRQIPISIFGNMLIESQLSSNFSDVHHIINTVGANIFGINPRMNTHMPNEMEKVNILNSTKIVLNTKTYGYFPIELIQGMACGCVPITYPYPGIEAFIPSPLIVNDKHQARQLVSDLLSDPLKMRTFSQRCFEISVQFRNDNLSDYIMKVWKETNESGSKFYTV